MMKKIETFWTKIWKSIKRLFIYLFGFGKAKEKAISLAEEEIVSPSKQIFRKFIHNRIAIFGLVLFLAIVLFVFIGGETFEFNAAYMEGSQQEVEPNMTFLNVPSKLKKSGIKVTTDDNGIDHYLIGVGSVYTVAISNDNKIYVWGANVYNIKKVPQEIQDKAADIVQLSVGQQHVVALTKNGEILAWGRNSHQQSQLPTYDPLRDESYEAAKKAAEAYFSAEARQKYSEFVVTTVETDPIKQVYAGSDYTTVLTENGYVYSWGIAFTKYIGIPNNSFGIYGKQVEYRRNPFTSKYELQWKYVSDTSWRTHKTTEELIAENNIAEVEGSEIVFKINNGVLEWRYDDKSVTDEPEVWTAIKTVQEYKDELPDLAKIVKVYPMENHVAYELEDNKILVRGLSGAVLNKVPNELGLSATDRGYRIIKVVGTRENAFYLTDTGRVIGWGGTETSVLNVIPTEVRTANIIDIESGSHHVVALADDGRVFTWGSNNDLHQLDIPKSMKKNGAAEKIISGFFVNYGVSSEGKITSWGNKGYLFGTNRQGHDNIQRIIIGGRMTLSIALIAVIVSLVLGLIVGLVSGFYGGWIDNVLMRFGEIINAFPFLPLAMTLAKLVEEWGLSDQTRIVLIMVILGLLSWPSLARLVRGQILAEREKDFVLAAKSLGIKDKHIITRHILPNVINVVIVSTTLSYAGALLTESGLSFLNFGVKYPNPSWGNMLVKAQDMTTYKLYWWLWVIPGLFIVLTALSINLVGDGLRDAMDPKSNER